MSKPETKPRKIAPPKAAATAKRPRLAAKPGAPLYLQVAHALKDEIVSGIYPVGSLLPTEDDLSARFAVSRYTVREALRRLREDSLVSSRQGAGTVVVPPRPSDSYIHHVTSIGDLLAFAAGLRFAIESIKMVEIDAPLAARTGIAQGGAWLAVSGFRYPDGEDCPVCWTEYYIHRDFAAVGRLLQRHKGPIFPLIEDLFGQPIVEVDQEIAAGTISPALAQGFKVEPGTAVLDVRRTYKMDKGKIAQVTINTHPAARFRHSMSMRRVKG